MPDNDENTPISAKPYAVKTAVYDSIEQVMRPARDGDIIEETEPHKIEPNKADLTLQAIDHRKCLFFFVLIVSAVMFIAFLMVFVFLYFICPNRLVELYTASGMVMIPFGLLLVAPVTMVLTLLHKLYKSPNSKVAKDDDDYLVPQVEPLDKMAKILADLIKIVKS